MTHITIEKEKIKLALEALALRYKSEWQDFERFADVIAALEEALASEQEQRNVSEQLGEPVAWIDNSGHPKHMNHVQSISERKLYGALRPLYTTPQPAPQGEARGLSQQKPLMLEKFREMEALLDDSNAPQHKTITDDELKIIMETTMPVIDWKARHGAALNHGEHNEWMLNWFIEFSRAIEAAHGIKENT